MVDMVEISKKMAAIDREVKQLNAQVKNLKEDRQLLEHQVMDLLDSIGSETGRFGKCDVVIKKKVFPKEIDWEGVLDYIVENRDIGILQRRLNVGRFEEMLEVAPELMTFAELTEKRSVDVKEKV